MNIIFTSSFTAKEYLIWALWLHLQSWTKYLYIFSIFSTICLNRKRNGTRYYHQKVNIRVAERLKTSDLSKFGDLKKIPEIFGFGGEYPAIHLKTSFWRSLVKHRQKSAVKHSIEKPILLKFVNLSPTFCPRL